MTHQESIDSTASYALDALGGEERTAMEAHLRDCAECRAEVAAYREVAGLLAHAAPVVRPPNSAALRERIIREARQVRPITSAPPPQLRAPAGTPLHPVYSPVGAQPAAAAASTAPRRPRTTHVAWAAAAAALVVAGVSGLAYRTEHARRARLEADLASARNEVALRDSTIAAFLGPEVHVVSLTAPTEKKPSVRVFWNHTRNVFIVTAHALPAPPPGKTYQLWALAKGKAPISMGTFTPDARGRATALVPVAANITDAGFIDDCAMTVEPAGGSSQPTETPRLIGTWRHVD